MTGPIRGERVNKTPDKFKDIKDQYTFDPDHKQNAAKKGSVIQSCWIKNVNVKGQFGSFTQ